MTKVIKWPGKGLDSRFPLLPLTLQTRFFAVYKVVIFAWNKCSPVCYLENSYSFLKTHLKVSSSVMLAAHTSEFL